MRIIACFLLAYCVINITNVHAAGGKSLVLTIKDDSTSNAQITSVEVDKEFYSYILKQIKSKKQQTSTVTKMNNFEEFLRMVKGDNCMCQCMCCDSMMTTTTTTTTPPPIPISTTTTTTTPPPITTTTTTTPRPITPSTRFPGVTYLPLGKPSTTERPSTKYRTYSAVTYYQISRNITLPTWIPRITKKTPTREPSTTTPLYAYYAPANRFYYPGEGLQLEKGGKAYYAVDPINLDIVPPKTKWSF